MKVWVLLCIDTYSDGHPETVQAVADTELAAARLIRNMAGYDGCDDDYLLRILRSRNDYRAVEMEVVEEASQ